MEASLRMAATFPGSPLLFIGRFHPADRLLFAFENFTISHPPHP
jgi:hypothetical protein